MHLAVAVAVPILVFLCLVWHRPDRKVALLFAVIAGAYGLPYVVLQGTPVSLDFLYREAPWAASTPPQSMQKNPLINDVPLQFLPWQEAARAAWRNGELPFYDRASGSGSPLWENPQAAVLFATSIAGLFTTTFAWPLLSLVTKLLLALWGMYLLLGTMSLSTPSRVFGAIAYAFSTFAIAFGLFPHTSVTSLLPLLLASLHRVHTGWRGTAAATAVTTAMLLAGHPEMVLHAAFIAIAYALAISWRHRSEASRLIPRFAAIGIVAALLAMPLLLPFAASIPDTQRYFEVQGQPSTHATPSPTLQNMVVLVIPNFFGNPRVHNYRHAFNYNDLSTLYAGLSTIALALAASFTAPRRHRFWIGLLAVSLLLSFQPAALAELLPHVPVIGLAPHGRMRFAITLALAILGAHGL